jgi:hypothetical protein
MPPKRNPPGIERPARGAVSFQDAGRRCGHWPFEPPHSRFIAGRNRRRYATHALIDVPLTGRSATAAAVVTERDNVANLGLAFGTVIHDQDDLRRKVATPVRQQRISHTGQVRHVDRLDRGSAATLVFRF